MIVPVRDYACAIDDCDDEYVSTGLPLWTWPTASIGGRQSFVAPAVVNAQ